MADERSEERKLGSGKSTGSMGDLVKAESMIQLAFVLPIGCVVGWLVGAWLDQRFHQGWIAIVGIVLGAIGGFIQIFRTASRYLRRDS